MKVQLGVIIIWDSFEKIATSFDFTQHHFDRLTFDVVLTNCEMFFPALIVVSPSIQGEHSSSLSAEFSDENHLNAALLVDIVTQFSLRLKLCSVLCEMFISSRKQFAAMCVRKFLVVNRYFIITVPWNILLFRLQHF